MISLQLFFVIHHFILCCLCSIFMLDIIFFERNEAFDRYMLL